MRFFAAGRDFIHHKNPVRNTRVRVVGFILWKETARAIFENSIKAITPGQAAVFYDGSDLIGGGWIDKVRLSDEISENFALNRQLLPSS